ncbi:hypothetical protein LTR17_016123 [Elasticomyces elasticus]|nr:hypothetical protein LTR17_016123 [Elasticomyces elasticus]
MESKNPNDHQDAHQHTDIPFSAFTPTEKWCITSLVAYASLFSTLSSFIYFPAIPSISESLSVSVAQINWTVTSYMAVASIGPTLVGHVADAFGRRPVYIAIFIIYTAANVGIAAADTYPSLVGLRVVQALAISGTFSITYGVVADIASPAERGSFVSLVAFAQVLKH